MCVAFGSSVQRCGSGSHATLQDGLILSLQLRSELAKDAGIAVAHSIGALISIGHFVASRSEVGRVFELAASAGASATGPAHERPWGIYSGYFADPDGHLWEIIHFPDGQSPDAGC